MANSPLDIKRRFKEFRKTLGITQEELANATMSDKTTISKIENEKEIKRTPSLKVTFGLQTKFGLNPVWLETGEGAMFISPNMNPETSLYPLRYSGSDKKRPENILPPKKTNVKFIGSFDYPHEQSSEVRDLGAGKYSFEVPLVYSFARAGVQGGWPDPEWIEELPRHTYIGDSYPHGEYMAFEVVGDSMENYTSGKEAAKESIPDGYIVTGRRLRQDHWRSHLHLHKYQDWIIVTEDDVFIKRITAHDVKTGEITCHSLNPDYKDFKINLKDVKMLLNVMPRYQ